MKGSYVVIADWMLELGLSSKELMVYALVYGVCSHNQSYYGTLEHTAAWARCHKDTAGDVLARLVGKGLLVKKEKYDGAKKLCFYTLGKAEAGGEGPPPGGGPPAGGGTPPGADPRAGDGGAGDAPAGPPREGPREGGGETPGGASPGAAAGAIGETPTAIGETPMAIGETPMAPSAKHRCTDLKTDLNLHPRGTAGGAETFADHGLDFARAYEAMLGKWNETPFLGRERKRTALTLTTAEQEAVRRALSLYHLREILNGIDNYIYMYEQPGKFRTKLSYGSLFNFLNKALPTFADDVTFRHQYYKPEYAS
jgi:hypothetical protein